MSSIITFFVAADDDSAAALAEGGPGEDLPSAGYGNFDVWTALAEWESLATDRSLMEIEEAGGAGVVSEGDDPVVLAFPASLTRALSTSDGPALELLAEQWIALRAEEDEDIDEELANDLLTDIAGLARTAVTAESALYVWVC
ncbi:hypothetical protein ACTI_57270 [Actinoplanes sp. OR16]|uniref:hypothetical protein n=1 Tax=Actinoplanes sp. OR16 TaxID=946334 RepID=UPI000F6F6E53|nr:hypothetical protein [Actinoplanes sp. OR16]BBH69042.1 hypothetical protein ACTI_57270 [Actinoplanes sp. OR16]